MSRDDDKCYVERDNVASLRWRHYKILIAIYKQRRKHQISSFTTRHPTASKKMPSCCESCFTGSPHFQLQIKQVRHTTRVVLLNTLYKYRKKHRYAARLVHSISSCLGRLTLSSPVIHSSAAGYLPSARQPASSSTGVVEAFRQASGGRAADVYLLRRSFQQRRLQAFGVGVPFQHGG
ncbi:hypothetical protein PR048_023828, partial [Dryococelus australis]